MTKFSIILLLLLIGIMSFVLAGNEEQEDLLSLKQKIEEQLTKKRSTKTPTLAPTADDNVYTLAPFTIPILIACQPPCTYTEADGCVCHT